MTALKYRKIPHTVEAMQWTGENFNQLADWAWDGQTCVVERVPTDEEHPDALTVYIAAEEQYVFVELGWWVVRGISGEFYPVTDTLFPRSFEPVDAEDLYQVS